ncbi:MAG: GNAT family N-acetyltransferase [Candidatus Margulisiibacteriota bacterium]
MNTLIFRDKPKQSDAKAVCAIVASSGYFTDSETEMAVELVEERLQKGEASGYYFLFVDSNGSTVGYTCFGPICCTKDSFDLYWIAVDNQCRGKSLGSELLSRSEADIYRMGGRRVYIETSSRDQYIDTRRFYLKNGYIQEAILQDFYGPGDSKVIFVKALG